MTISRFASFLIVASLTAGCGIFGGPPRPGEGQPTGPTPIQKLFELYDTNHDGMFSRAELEAGLRADFAKADKNHDGRLDADEARAVNQQRWENDASMASPLVDWNQDGVIDFNEFAATARSLFEQYDLDGDGVITRSEVHAVTHPYKRPPPIQPDR